MFTVETLVEDMALIWQHSFSVTVAGPSGSGKTHFVVKFIENANRIMNPPPLKILYCYGVYQALFSRMPQVEFHEGLPDLAQLTPRTLLIIDDLMSEADQRVTDIFTKHSHHRDVSVMFLTQNLFYKGARTISLNAHYLVLFKNPRDASQIAFLARQIFPLKSKFMIESYEDATADPYSYLVVDLKPTTNDKTRLRSGVFPDDVHYAYEPK